MPALSYTLLIDGGPAAPELLERVQQLEVEEHCDLADMMRLRLALSVRADGSDWNTEESLFPRLGKVRIVATVGPTRVPLIEAHVIETEAAFSNEPGASTLDIVAMDPSVLLNLEEKIRPWPNMTDSDIALAILDEHGLEAKIADTSEARQELDTTVIQRGTDMQFLRELAYRNGFECHVELNSLGVLEGHFHPPALDAAPQGVLTVNMGDATNVNLFHARFEMLRPTAVRATGFDVRSVSEQIAEVAAPSFKNLGDRNPLETEHPRLALMGQSGLQRTGELQTLAQATVNRSGWAIVAEGELNPAAYGGVLRARRIVSVRGAGRQFSGEFYVEKVVHLFNGDGYLQRFTLRRNATGLTGREAFSDDVAAAS